MNFFGFVAWEKIVCYGDSVPVHHKSHFDDGIRTVVLFRTALSVLGRYRFSVFIYRVAVLIKGINIRMADIEIVVGAVKVGCGNVSLADLF